MLEFRENAVRGGWFRRGSKKSVAAAATVLRRDDAEHQRADAKRDSRSDVVAALLAVAVSVPVAVVARSGVAVGIAAVVVASAIAAMVTRASVGGRGQRDEGAGGDGRSDGQAGQRAGDGHYRDGPLAGLELIAGIGIYRRQRAKNPDGSFACLLSGKLGARR